MATTLPEEMITEILSWMSRKPLTRFKCVSKPWCKLISSPDFIKLQSERSSEPLLVILTNSFGPDFKTMELDAPDHPSSSIEHRLLSERRHIDIVGSSNGFLCLRLHSDQGVDFEFALYNPITRFERLLPPCILPPQRDIFFMYNGFGYDPTIDDFKLVSIFYCYNGLVDNRRLRIITPLVWVYSLKADKWVKSTVSRETPCYVDPGSDYLSHFFNNFVNNAFHWIGFRTRTSSFSFNSQSVTIACFGFSNEQFYEIALPNLGFDNHDEYHLELGVLGRRLHILVENKDLWVLKEYGMKESWTKLYTLPYIEGILRPIVYWRTGSEILFQKQTVERDEINKSTALFSLDLKNRTIRDLRIHLNTLNMVGYYEKTQSHSVM